MEEDDILEEGSEGEWTRYVIELPEDDFDEDDDEDAQLAAYRRRRKTLVKRGHGLRGI